MPAVTRKTKTSLPTSPAGMEDISHLTLGEVQARLERNNRVLGTSLFSTSPNTTNTLSTSPHSPRNTFGGRSSASPISDPVRDRLLAARKVLQAREQELLLEQGMLNMDMDSNELGQNGKMSSNTMAESSTDARRRSSVPTSMPVRSGKARAMESIKATEGGLHPNGIILPYDQSLALGEKEFDKITADRMANMSIRPQNSSSIYSPSTSTTSPTRRKKYDPTDEIARAQANARVKAFMNYKSTNRARDNYDPEDGGDGERDYDDNDDDGDGFFEDDWGMEGEYDGDGDKFILGSQGREPMLKERGTGEEVDQMGEDDEAWAEGNDDYLDMNR